jgi:renalase
VHDLIVVGAGVAGLQCARSLNAAGARVLVVDRAGKVGGRCATRSFAGIPADYGPLFLHGSDPDFLAALDGVAGSSPLEGWPHHVSGTGQPCQPSAFAPGERRMAFRDGVNVFAQALAEGLSIRLNTQVSEVVSEDRGFVVRCGEGNELRTRELVLAMALEQSLPFLRMLPPEQERDGAIGLLGMFTSLPCLTLIAGYGASARAPDWEVLYPEESRELLLVGHESSKRPGGGSLCLVYQAQPHWSLEHLGEPKERWARELLGCAASLLGSWAGEPESTHAHRWRYSRLNPADELSGPLQLTGDCGRLSLVGDLFAPGGGVQASWRSGSRLAERIRANPLP